MIHRGGKSKGNGRSRSSEGKKSCGALPNGLKIIFEDEALFVVEKPCGMSVSAAYGKEKFSDKPSLKTLNSTSVGSEKKITKKVSIVTNSNTKTVHSIVSSFLGKRAGSADSKVFVVNRLEDDESGLVIFAKSVASKEYLLKNWNTFGIVYNVICEGLFFPQQGTIKTYMDETGSLVTCSPTKSETAKSSPLTISHYRTLDSVSSTASLLLSLNSNYDKAVDIDSRKNKIDDTQSYSILEISLDTTRKDQIRSQLSYLNHSVCGDYKYGPLAVSLLENNLEDGSSNDISDNNSDDKSIHDPIRRLGIHFSEIRMTHPSTKDSMTMASNSPSSFNDLIKRIQSQTSSSAKHDLFSLTSEFRSEKNPEKEDGGDNEDGDSDGLQKGSQKHSADSKSNKVKVMTLTDFLGPRAKSSGGKSHTSEPPSNAGTALAPRRSFKKKR
jgi:23S rRNA-/tRNA-specific pseudouridylate synthase